MHRVTPEPRQNIVTTGRVPGRAIPHFAQLSERGLNFDPISFEEARADPSWNVDSRSGIVGRERPGPPVEDGPYSAARSALVSYEFADPRIVRAVFDAAHSFDGRDMLLVGRFAGLRFFMGVRVGGVEEGDGEEAARPVHRFRWHYRTLEGHLEEGQMNYELIKWPETGEIQFRIRAYSRWNRVFNPAVRLGLAVFGRREQHRFYDASLRRLRDLVTPSTTGG